MLGSNYNSLEEFRDACMSHNRRSALNTNYTLSKVYSADQLRHIAMAQELDLQSIENRAVDSPAGIQKRYALASSISEICEFDQLGLTLSRVDHELVFPIMSYFRLPDTEFWSSVDNLFIRLRNQGVEYTPPFTNFLNGISNPAGRSPKLESVRVFDDSMVVSMLFSCSRILVIPEGQQGDFNSYFLARIPILARIIFSHRLLEISMPTFSEPVGTLPEGASNRVPDKYQAVILNVRTELQGLISDILGIDYAKVTLYLETHCDALDMGWRIEPQSSVEFDLTQSLVPLREILDDFTQTLASECRRRGIHHPLADINLYHVFRALKEQSYTYSFVLQAPIGARGGIFKIASLYGIPNSIYDPILWIPDNYFGVLNAVRDAVHQSQEIELPNLYDLEALFSA